MTEQGMNAIDDYRCPSCGGHGWWRNCEPYKPCTGFPDEWPLTGRFEFREDGYKYDSWRCSFDDHGDQHCDPFTGYTDAIMYVWDGGERVWETVDKPDEGWHNTFIDDCNRLLDLAVRGLKVCFSCKGTGLDQAKFLGLPLTLPAIMTEQEEHEMWEAMEADWEERFLNHDYVYEVRFGYDGYDG